nr:hypothetical protein [uncultured Albidiferax sp.]
MRVTSAQPKPMPPRRASRGPWVSALAWLLFCAAMVAVALLLSPRIGVVDDPTMPVEATAPVLASADGEHAIPMAAIVLYPNEAAALVVKH